MKEKLSIPFHDALPGIKPEECGYDSTRLDILDEHLKALIEKKRIQAGAYLISRNGRILAHRSMGLLRYNDRKPFLPDTIRRVASVTKLFTAASILKLAEDGKLRLDQSLASFIEEFRNPMYEKINIQHLLTHTSGIRPDPGCFLEPYQRKWDFYDTKEWMKCLLTDYLAVEPGKEWRYSSAGFNILAEVVTRVSGIRFEQYVMKNILMPLGMTRSSFQVPAELAGEICFATDWEEEWFAKGGNRPEWSAPKGGGGLFSCLPDMQRFGQMLINKGTLDGERILSRKTVEAMTRNQSGNVKNFCWGAGGSTMEYGLGLNVYSNNTFLSPGSFSHEGAGLCGLYMDPVENVVLAYICPLCDGVGWEPEAVISLRNIVWSGIL